MREIKFRGWDRNEKKMVKITGIRFSDVQHTLVRYRYVNTQGKVIDDQSHIDEEGVGSIILMQYTGLKDKNGVEIYEGDIVEGNFPKMGVDRGVVVFEQGFQVEIPGIDDLDNLYDWTKYTSSIEVLGNIHDNPELLGEG